MIRKERKLSMNTRLDFRQCLLDDLKIKVTKDSFSDAEPVAAQKPGEELLLKDGAV